MDYTAFCRRFFLATGIPVNLLLHGKPVYTSLGEQMSFLPQEEWMVYPQERNPEFNSISPDFEYGHVRIEGTGYDLFIGPVFTAPPAEALLLSFMHDAHTPSVYREALFDALQGLPVESHAHFVRYLNFLHLCLNGRDEDMEGAEEAEGAEPFSNIFPEAGWAQAAYDHEAAVFRCISEGNIGKLRKLLQKGLRFPEQEHLARLPLRQAKNAFISRTEKAAAVGAVPGGFPAREAQSLVNFYVLECEQLQTIREIHRLEQTMLLDFCGRVDRARLPESVSPEIHEVMNYIKSRINDPIGIDDAAECIHRSVSYLTRKFKAETGQTVGSYITEYRIREACELLRFTDRSLSEISEELQFSSQSYFQNVFKKQMGMTPQKYRKKSSEATDPQERARLQLPRWDKTGIPPAAAPDRLLR